MKKVTFGGKPTSRPPGSPDQWVSGEAMKRLTIDIPLSLHQRVKSQCALKGEKMADVVRELLERRFPPQHQEAPSGGDAHSK
jgi:hypothetical protein